nr:histidine kinase [Kibdelosporangium sp. MJ126-NF4]CEL23392.1 two-component system sensor kinase [Kibdelosporangium sp. MJ126-NF4]CTQ96872.1 two-component system sensor kinase [Kibdelosporangium sp. MJ126-NF4]
MSEQRPFLARKLKLWELVAVDVVAAAGLLAAHISFLSLPGDASQEAYSGPLWFGWLFSITATLPMAVRRLWPWPVLGLTLLGSALATIFNATREPWVPAAAALYILAATNRRPALALAAAIGGLVTTVLVTATVTPPQFADLPRDIFLFVFLIMVATWAVGRWIEARRSYMARSAQQLAQSMVSDERLRIARELHDVVAHSMSLIAVKAGIANHVADQRPQEARDALRVIESTSRNTLIEMRQLLGILRSSPELPGRHHTSQGHRRDDTQPTGRSGDDGSHSPDSAAPPADPATPVPRVRSWLAKVGGVARSDGPSRCDPASGTGLPAFGQHGHDPELAPAPGLSDLPALAQHARSAGVDVTMTVPSSVSLPSGLELSAYRIVQEALTNVVKHAGSVPCAVDVSAAEGVLRISIVDSGRGGALGAPESGHGLVGMRERVMMYGGEFAAGPLPAGGFAVSASLPYPGAPS